jgi:hypothetical protein
MNNLDNEWQQRLAEAERRARVDGRKEVADYLALRATNDLARATGTDWLISAFLFLAGEANRNGAKIELSRKDSHQFQIGSSIMTGTQLILRIGLKALTIEAGWPRKPGDGIVRGGGLARARIEHFGKRGMDQDLILLRDSNNRLRWSIIESTGLYTRFLEDHLYSHLKQLTF